MEEESAEHLEPWLLRYLSRVLAVGFLLAVSGFGVAYWLTGGRFQARFDTGLKAATAIAAVVAGALTWARLELSRAEHVLSVDRDLTDRYIRAMELLGSDNPTTRVGGVFALERFALDAAARASGRGGVDWRMALDGLASFARRVSQDVREASDHLDSASRDAVHKVAPVDVVEAVRVLGRFSARSGLSDDIAHDLGQVVLGGADLAGGDLRGAPGLTGIAIGGDGARLVNANLKGADLRRTSLANADLTGANLRNADLRGANLAGAKLSGILAGANLSGADLAFAFLAEADLTGADLSKAHLAAADLTAAVLENARLIDADFGRADGLGRAIYDERTAWPEGFTPPSA